MMITTMLPDHADDDDVHVAHIHEVDDDDEDDANRWNIVVALVVVINIKYMCDMWTVCGADIIENQIDTIVQKLQVKLRRALYIIRML